MKKLLSLLLSLFFVLTCFSGCSDKKTVVDTGNIKLPEGSAFSDTGSTEWVVCGEGEGIRLSFMPDTTHFRIENLKDGSVWYSNPQSPENDTKASKLTQMKMMSTLVLEYANVTSKKRTSLNLYTSSVKSGKYTIKLIDNGVRFDYTVNEIGGTASLAVYIEDGTLVTDVAFEKTDDTKNEVILSAISSAQYFVSGTDSDNGYLFLPDGSGSLVDFESDTPSAGGYSRPIFGEEPTNITGDYYLQCGNQAVFMPVFGAVKNNSAIFAVAENGAELGTLKANSCGQETSYANTYVSYGFVDSVEYDVGNYSTELFDKSGYMQDVIRTRYFFLSDTDADYSGMARTYRKYLTEKYDLSGNNISHGFYADIYGAALKRVSTLGIPHDKFVTLTSVKDIEKITKYLKDNGIDDITLRYRSWNKDELKGNRVNSVSAFSGVSLNDLSKFEQARVYPAVLNLQQFWDAGFFDRMFTSSASITGLPFSWKGYTYSTLNETGSSTYRLKVPKLQENAEKLLEAFNKKKIKRLGFGDIGNGLYCDFGGDGYRRSKTLAVMEDIVKKASSQTDSLMLDSPNAYAAVYADVIYNAPVDHSNQDILDRSVPFYTMAMSGISECVSPSFNSNNIGDNVMLYSVASGTSLCYSWLYGDVSQLIGTKLSGLSDVNFDSTKEIACEQYKKLNEIYKMTEDSRIYSHNYIDEKVSVTEYENGVRVYVNFGNSDYHTEQGLSVKAESFAVEEAKEN